MAPFEDRLAELLGHLAVDLDTAVELVNVTSAGGGLTAPHRRPEHERGVPEPGGAIERVGCARNIYVK